MNDVLLAVVAALSAWIVRPMVFREKSESGDELRRSLVELCKKADRLFTVGESLLLYKGLGAGRSAMDLSGLAKAFFPDGNKGAEG